MIEERFEDCLILKSLGSGYLTRRGSGEFSEGGSRPPRPARKSRAFFYRRGLRFKISISGKMCLKLDPPGQSLACPGGPSRAQSVGLVANHRTWPSSCLESAVWAENGSRSMPGPFRSVWDGSNPLKRTITDKRKHEKVCPSRPRMRLHAPREQKKVKA